MSYNFLKTGEDGVPELYLDHQMLSDFRKCEAYFVESYMNCLGHPGRAWPLDFGSWLHYSMEEFYQAIKNGVPLDYSGWIDRGFKNWKELDMDYHQEHKTFKLLGGVQGASALLAQYNFVYGGTNERLRVVATEIAFGRDKEVPILEEQERVLLSLPARYYLTGRMDLLMDDGYNIGPLDHKTKTVFRGDEVAMFNPHEGMTGYIYAGAKILNKYFPEIRKPCNRIWVNHIQVSPSKITTDCYSRFKRLPVSKTVAQLEEYRQRQVETFSRIFDVVSGKRKADWNTSTNCKFWFRDCTFKSLHEQPQDVSTRLTMINSKYVIREPWNPYQGQVSVEME